MRSAVASPRGAPSGAVAAAAAAGRAGGAAIEPIAGTTRGCAGDELRQKLVQSGEASAAYSEERGVLAPPAPGGPRAAPKRPSSQS